MTRKRRSYGEEAFAAAAPFHALAWAAEFFGHEFRFLVRDPNA